MLSEISQSQKDKYCMISQSSLSSQNPRDSKQGGGYLGLRGGRRGSCLTGRVSVLGEEKNSGDR